MSWLGPVQGTRPRDPTVVRFIAGPIPSPFHLHFSCQVNCTTEASITASINPTGASVRIRDCDKQRTRRYDAARV